MSTNLFTDMEIDHYKLVFYKINKSQTGNLTRLEFLQAYWEVGLKSMSENEFDKVLSYVDSDQNGFITFPEFMIASIVKEHLLTQ